METRQLGPLEYLAAVRRRVLPILGLAALCTLLGYFVSFALTPKFTSRALLQVEPQVLPSGYVKPIVTERLSDRVAMLQQRVLTREHLLPLVEHLGLAKTVQAAEIVVEKIRTGVTISPAEPGSSLTTTTTTPHRKLNDQDDVPGFFVSYTSDNPREAQQVCSEVTSVLLEENLKLRQQVGKNTTEFLDRQLEQAKHNLDGLDSELASFKKQHLGRLPGDVENNLKILSGLDSQLDANTQLLDRAQQEKSFVESLLAQEVAAYKSNQEAPNLPPLREQLINLQNLLITLRSHYTDDHPDVVKVKNDIAEIKQKLSEAKPDAADANTVVANRGANEGVSQDKERPKMEPGDILRLRERLHQIDSTIDRGTAEEQRIKNQIDNYQGRIALSPEIEEAYKRLTRDTESAHTIYDGLLVNRNSAAMQSEMEREQQGEQIRLLESANYPLAPSFPKRWAFAAGGLAFGLFLSIGTVILFELADRSIHHEGDVATLLDLPTLASVPWVLPGASENGDRRHNRLKPQLAR
jgi:polysaccharide chain length determinant protein (PEP-CTERM system associated)